MTSLEDTTVDDDAASRAGAENDTKHGVRTCACAVGCLRQRKAVRIIHYTDRTLKRSLQIAIDSVTDQPRRVGVLDSSRARRNCAGYTDADAARCRELRL